MSGNLAGNAAGLDGGDTVGYDVNSEEKERTGTTDVLRPAIQWRSKLCLNVAAVHPLPRSGSPEISVSSSPNRPQSPALTSSSFPTSPGPFFSPQIRSSRHWLMGSFTQTCPFSFDLRDSMQRVAHERKLERLREESHLAMFTFKANPVRKYKPLVVKQSTRQLTVPKLPFSRSDPRK